MRPLHKKPNMNTCSSRRGETWGCRNGQDGPCARACVRQVTHLVVPCVKSIQADQLFLFSMPGSSNIFQLCHISARRYLCVCVFFFLIDEKASMCHSWKIQVLTFSDRYWFWAWQRLAPGPFAMHSTSWESAPIIVRSSRLLC